jgi:uncharacterized membrane protein YkvA (DUF1232 family)
VKKKTKKTKAAATKKKPGRAPKRNNPAPALKARLDAEFANAVASAKTYVENPQRLSELFDEAVKEAASMPRGPFGENWPYFHAMLRLIRSYADGDYRAIPESTLVVIVAAIIFVVNPLDVIPDALPALGYLDDATVISLAVKRSRDALHDFMAWENRAR